MAEEYSIKNYERVKTDLDDSDDQVEVIKTDNESSSTQLNVVLEDQDKLFQSLFSQKGSFRNEKWDKVLYVDGCILDLSNSIAVISCLMDEKKKVFKEKIFPIDILSHIYGLKEGKFIRIKMMYKSGSFRYDLFDADNLIPDKEIFTSQLNWNKLDDFQVDNPHE